MAEAADTISQIAALAGLRARRQQRQREVVAFYALRRLRQQLVPVGAQGTGPVATESTEQVVLQKDVLNVVGDHGSQTGGTTQVEVTRDTDGGMRWWATPASGATYVQNRLLGRGSASGTGIAQEITVGSGLALSGTTLLATGSGLSDAFTTFLVSGQSDITSSGATSVEFVAGTNITLTTDDTLKTLTIDATGGGGSLDDGIALGLLL